MIAELAAGVMATMSLSQPGDTVISVHSGDRVLVRAHSGSVTVRTWDRDAARVDAGAGSGGRLEIRRDGSVLSIRTGHDGAAHGGDVPVHLTLTVPPTVPLDIQAPFADIVVEGIREKVRAESVEGHIRVRGGAGLVSVHTVEGDIRIEGSRGVTQANTVDGNVRISGVTGDVTADAVDGDVWLEALDSRNVRANTVDGQIVFDGRIHDDGIYRLGTHDGDVVARIPEGTNATVTVATYDGDFVSSFPVSLQGSRAGNRFEFSLGTGAARLELQSFDGEIRLLRPGDPLPSRP